MSETQTGKNWYEQTWVIVLCLIFFFPVGLILMWKFADWSNVVKVIVTIGVVAFIFIFIIMIFLFIFGVIGFITYTINVMTMMDMQTSDSEPISGIGESDNQISENNNDLSDEEANGAGVDETVLDQFDIQFDDRDWEVNFEEEIEDGIFVREYLLEKESADDWNEVITLHFMAGIQDQPLTEFVTEMKNEALQNGVDEDDVKMEVIEESDDELIYEFIIEDSMVAPGRDELARIMKDDNGVYILHYANADVPMDNDEKDAGLKLLKQSKIK